MPWRSVGLGDAVLLVVGFPVSLLAVSAAVHHEATPGASRKLRSIGTPFRHETVAANLAVGGRFLRASFLG
jgi:hypothetical protein